LSEKQLKVKERSLKMQETFKKTEEFKSQIAFFAILCIALLFANFLMMSLSGTKLTEPIKLGYAGISAQIPTGVQWDSEQQWQYGNNSFYLTSTLIGAQGRPIGSIRCQYFLESSVLTSEELISRKVSEFSGEAAEKGETTNAGFIIQWVNIKIPESTYEVYYGITKLASNHLIEVEIQKIDANFKAEEIFEDILKNLQLENKPPIQTGIDTIQEIKDTGAISFLNTIDSPSAFLIMDSKGNPVGFKLDVYVPGKDNAPFEFGVQGLRYLREPYSQWESLSFYSDNSVAEYIWRSERIISRNKREIQTILDKDGTIAITDLSVPPAGKKYIPTFSSIPEVFADMLFKQILESKRNEVNVEIIESSGRIIPMSIFKFKPEITRPDLDKPAYALQMDFLDGSGLSQKIYFDNQGQIIRERLVVPLKGRRFPNAPSGQEVLVLVRSTAENLAAQFPEQAEQILQKISTNDVN
jgi:hypothetical protein